MCSLSSRFSPSLVRYVLVFLHHLLAMFSFSSITCSLCSRCSPSLVRYVLVFLPHLFAMFSLFSLTCSLCSRFPPSHVRYVLGFLHPLFVSSLIIYLLSVNSNTSTEYVRSYSVCSVKFQVTCIG